MNILITIILLLLVGLAVLFYFLNKRVDKLILKVVQLDRAIDSLGGNDKVLEKDIKNLFHESKNAKKENNRRR
jgi:cell division protein FtsB